MAHYLIQSHLVDSMVDVWRDETYLPFFSCNTQLRLSGVRRNHTQSQQPGTSCAWVGMASHSSTNCFLKSANVEQRLAALSILTTPSYWWVGQIRPVLSGAVQGISQVDGLYLPVFMSALCLYSLLSVALKRAMKDLTHFSGDQSTTACSVRATDLHLGGRVPDCGRWKYPVTKSHLSVSLH